MLIAQAKRKENIAEYILYMWQVEDLIRAFKLDIKIIDEHIIQKYQVDDAVKKEIKTWYEELIAMMRIEGVVEKGHLRINSNSVALLQDLHLGLLKSPKHIAYHEMYGKALNELALLKSHQDEGIEVSDMEVCFTFLYGLLTLRLKKQEISKETLQSAEKIQKLLAYVSKMYHKEKNNPEEDIL